ncbi:AbrB/MazE/SpoVT family DNA-binding domain-containing protein [Candidatus Woesearchaeota archaeon]|nr:AbrB/MazE/SpoVT family DNA-binding domain-containing protein [Candidatus Woesearchaeota archaeon]
MQQHTFIVDKAKLGKKGQLTIPKKIRDEDGLQENDEFIVMHMPGGDITLQKKRKRSPEDMMLQAGLERS